MASPGAPPLAVTWSLAAVPEHVIRAGARSRHALETARFAAPRPGRSSDADDRCHRPTTTVGPPLTTIAPSVIGRIGPVYTPRARRRQGFAAAATSVATQEALARGAVHVALYADVANATANAAYQRIGYVPDHDAEARRFIRR